MEHTPVLLRECIEGLDIKRGGVYVDGTLGRGGHAREIVKRLDAGSLIAIDSDADAIKDAAAFLSEYSEKISFVKGNFREIKEILEKLDTELVDGMLFDLGVSSPQLDDVERGFSYMRDAALDMRMDRQGELTAYDIVNDWHEDRLKDILFRYGEERYSAQIARAIVKKRAENRIKTTFELNAVILSAMPAAARREAQHPSKRCYQALRIATNDELGSIRDMLDSAPYRLKTGGRLCIISFHSLEDRIVKSAFASLAAGCVCPKDFPVCVCGNKPVLKLVTKKPVSPGAEELESNPRSRSAKLRIAERV